MCAEQGGLSALIHLPHSMTYFSLYILKTLEAITMPRAHSEFGQWSWDSEITTKANGFLHQVTNFQFLVTFCTTMTVLSIIHGLTIKLQKQCQDILDAREHVSEVQLELELILGNCEEEFHQWYEDVTQLSGEL